jgi:hypothetical protein
LKVEAWVDGGLILVGDLNEGIEEAYQQRRYVEAFTLLHGYIDFLMIDLYELHLALGGAASGDDLENAIDENPTWRTSVNRLRKLKIIDDVECGRLDGFNLLRNRIVHRLIIRSFQSSRKERITQAEADQGFLEGTELVRLLAKKTGKFVPTAWGKPPE